VSGRYVVVGLALARSGWYREVARWASAGAVPVELVLCTSAHEVGAIFDGGRPVSALLTDVGHPGFDRDLVTRARAVGAAVLVVDDGAARRDVHDLGAQVALAPLFDQATLLGALTANAVPVDELSTIDLRTRIEPPVGPRSQVIAVTGVPGTGATTTARAVAQGIAARPGTARVLLADLALDADQAAGHHLGDVLPGLPELVEAHRFATLGAEQVLDLTWTAEHIGYRLLPGMRRHRDWAALRPHAIDAALASLLSTFDIVVCDVDGDVEGEADTGSLEVGDRNHLARAALACADLVLVTGRPDTVGLTRLVRLLRDLIEHGIDHQRLVATLAGVPKRPLRRAELVAALHLLTAPLVPATDAFPPPMLLPWRPDLEAAVRDGVALPRQLAEAAAAAADAHLRRVGSHHPAASSSPDAGAAVAAGSLGHWRDDVEARP